MSKAARFVNNVMTTDIKTFHNVGGQITQTTSHWGHVTVTASPAKVQLQPMARTPLIDALLFDVKDCLNKPL